MENDSDPDDAALIRSNFAALFDSHAPHIHRYLARRLGDQSADDLVAETFLTAFRRRASFRADQRDARPWLYGIATRLVAQQPVDQEERGGSPWMRSRWSANWAMRPRCLRRAGWRPHGRS